MKQKLALGALALLLALTLPVGVRAAEPTAACYPTSVTRSEDGTEIRKIYDLGPNDDPGGIPRSDFEQDGYYYTMTDLLKQELPENESRQHTETVSVPSKNKDMASVLALLPQTKEFVTDDGLAGTLTLQLETVQVKVSGYGSSTKEVRATRRYPNLASQDTQYIPKSIEEDGRSLKLQDISWQMESASEDSYTIEERYTAVATYTGSATSRYVKGYTVTADYSGTVSRIALNKTRYVAIFEGVAIEPEEPPVPSEPIATEPVETEPSAPFSFNWAFVLVPLAVIAVAGAGVGIALFIKRRYELVDGGDDK